MISRLSVISGLALAAAASAATYPPGSPEAVTATAGRWTLYRAATPTTPAAILRTGASWPVADGSDIPGGMPDGYHWLLDVRIEPPPGWDSRLYQSPPPCEESIEVAAHERRITCAAVLRPAAELCGAVHNRAQERITAALSKHGLSDPADQWRALGLMAAERDGQRLNPEQTAFLERTRAVGIDYVDSVRAVEAALCAAVEADPQTAPDDSDPVWPPLPTATPSTGE